MTSFVPCVWCGEYAQIPTKHGLISGEDVEVLLCANCTKTLGSQSGVYPNGWEWYTNYPEGSCVTWSDKSITRNTIKREIAAMMVGRLKMFEARKTSATDNQIALAV